MSDSNAPQPNPEQQQSHDVGGVGGVVNPDRLVFCELPNQGGTIITTMKHCTDDLNGTPQAKAEPPPASTVLVTCATNGKSIRTTASDCTVTLQGAIQTAPPLPPIE